MRGKSNPGKSRSRRDVGYQISRQVRIKGIRPRQADIESHVYHSVRLSAAKKAEADWLLNSAPNTVTAAAHYLFTHFQLQRRRLSKEIRL
jgi:hypothetical protein